MAVLLKLFRSVDGDAFADARLKRPAISDNGGGGVLQSEASRVEQRDLVSIARPGLGPLTNRATSARDRISRPGTFGLMVRLFDKSTPDESRAERHRDDRPPARGQVYVHLFPF